MAKQGKSTATDGKDSPGNGGGRRYKSRSSGGVADWGSVNAEVIRAAIAAVSRIGGALRFGYTRDGGAYAVGVMGDGEPYTEYIGPGGDVEDVLKGITEAFQD